MLALVSGARAAERALLDDLDALLGGDRDLDQRLEQLRRPIVVVVPSRTLREHLIARWLERRGRPAAGVVFLTLRALALDVLARCGEPPPGGALLFDVLVRRMARDEPALAERLEPLVDGYGAVSATVRDLLDAGLGDDETRRAAEELLAADGAEIAPQRAVERARALVRTARGVGRAMELLEIGRGADVLRAAARWIERDPERALPARAVRVFGFSDATGVALDLIEALTERRDARLIVDLPPRPGAAAQGLEQAFAERLLERFAGAERAPCESALGERAAQRPEIELFSAPGGEAEVVELARRLRAAIDGGAPPEALGVVARDLEAYRLHLTRQLEARGIPYYAPGLRAAAGAARRLALAFLELLRRRGGTPVERWLEACGARAFDGARSADLRLALHSLGAGRLEQVAAIEPRRHLRTLADGRRALPLPLVEGFEADDPDAGAPGAEGVAGPSARRRHLAGEVLEAAVARARALLERLDEAASGGTIEARFDALRAMLSDELGHHLEPVDPRPGDRRSPAVEGAPIGADETRSSPAGEIAATLAAAGRRLPARTAAELELDASELLLVVESALAEVGLHPLAGRGGGVRVLSITDARAMTFDRLFVLGMNRDRFPRVVREDPLLADDLRRALTRILPDTPIKGRGHDEERYLFAQLLSAAPRVTLSWQSADDEGRSLARSPLLARLDASDAGEPHRAPPPLAPPTTGSEPALRPAAEHAMLAGLYGDRERFAALLPLALEAAGSGAETARRRAAALVQGLAELEPGLPVPPPGPFFGFLGDVGALGADDPRRRELWVTLLERLIACPWQTFLERLLRLAPPPDPLAALPELSPLLVGQLVHSALETIAGRGLGERRESLADALAAPPAEVAWPDDDEVERLLLEGARRLLADEGVGLPGLALPLALRARPYLDAAREQLWPADGSPLAVWGAELGGALELGGGERARRLRFRGDLLAERDGRPLLVDLKTGAPVSDGKKPETRRRHLRQAVQRGAWLQATAYALAGGAEPGPDGAYLFLRPGIADHLRWAIAEGEELRPELEGAAEVALAAWDEGVFFPRLVDAATGKEPGRCSWCTVSEACLRGDSGSRRRLVEGVERLADRARSEQPLGRRERSLLALWHLPSGTATGFAPEAAPESEGGSA